MFPVSILRAVSLVNFKRNLLNLDLQSRRFFLERCIEFIQSESDQNSDRNTLLTWFDRCLTLAKTDPLDTEVKTPEFWSVIFELHASPILSNIVMNTRHLG